MEKILWLCSWYPNPLHPFDGDFIQRHARAVSGYVPVTVFYVDQSGDSVPSDLNGSQEQLNKGVTENRVFFPFRRTGIALYDKLVYNLRYYRAYRKAIHEYIRLHGKPDLVHVHIPMKAGMVAGWIQRKWGIPYLVSEHSTHYLEGTHDAFSRKSKRHRLQVKNVFRKAAAVTNVSKMLSDRISGLFGLSRVEVVMNTVDDRLFYQKPLTTSRFRFIHVSTLSEHQKNVEGILRAAQNLAARGVDFELVIVGPATDRLKQAGAALAASGHLQFTGEIPYQQVAAEMQQSSALVLFSRYENLPCVIIEAFSCGLPVISSRVGGIPEIIDTSNGLLVEPGDEKALADAMAEMLRNNGRFDPAAIANKARQTFGYATIGKQFYELYKKVIAETKA